MESWLIKRKATVEFIKSFEKTYHDLYFLIVAGWCYFFENLKSKLIKNNFIYFDIVIGMRRLSTPNKPNTSEYFRI